MAHWRIFLSITLVIILGGLYLTEDRREMAPMIAEKAPVRLSEIVVQAPVPLRAPSAALALQKPIKSKQASLNVGDAEAVHDSQRAPLKVAGHVWNWLSGVVAVVEDVAREQGLIIMSSARGFAVVSASEVPAEVESFSLLERADNGLVGVLTGVIVAQSFEPLENPEGVANTCGVSLGQSYPAIKSYLFKKLDKFETEELITCLRETGLFKRLEWEILSGPRLAQ